MQQQQQRQWQQVAAARNNNKMYCNPHVIIRITTSNKNQNLQSLQNLLLHGIDSKFVPIIHQRLK